MTDTQFGPPTTTDGGALVASDEHSLTVGSDGPVLLHDHYLIEQMANFNRERIPERQPHAKGGGAFGRFEVTNDVSAYTKAAVFQPGVTTDMLVRFSTVAGERGSPDTWRDPRGFSEPVLQRSFEYWHNVDKDLGDKVETGVRDKQNEKDPKAAQQANPARTSMQAKA